MSPSTRRAWIEIIRSHAPVIIPVSPSTRRAWIEISCAFAVATLYFPSPSTRRAWIEIRLESVSGWPSVVALHPEGVDRNCVRYRLRDLDFVALHPEGVDRNARKRQRLCAYNQSPSTRRAWIEISGSILDVYGGESPSTRRAWIEMRRRPLRGRVTIRSPSTRRAWIEIPK